MNWCMEQCGNIRIDTHANNKPMQVRDTWSAYVSGGNAALAEPENYIKLR